jgi:GNAT superfamily N-acetyltransferase
MDSAHTIGLFRGPEIIPYLDDVARLRISVFRAWPYLYAGDIAYERTYLATYGRSVDSLFVLAFDDGVVVGASTGVPMAEETPAFARPLQQAGMAVEEVFYFGESVLLPQYRGRGIGHAFFDAREQHARGLARFRWTGFCAVQRDADDPRQPPGHRGNEAFWRKRGYVPQPGMTVQLPWEEVDQGEVIHPLGFWLRPLESNPTYPNSIGRPGA